MKIQLLYYSGAGNTKFIAKHIKESLLHKNHTVNSIRLTEKSIDLINDDFDVLLLGFPVYFRDAPELVYKTLEKSSGKNRPIMIFLTKGLYSGNSIRNIIEASLKRKFAPIGFMELFMPGSDLLTSKIKANSISERMFTSIHSVNILNKINDFVNKIDKNKIIKTISKKWYTFFDESIVKKIEKKYNNSYKDWIEKIIINEKKCIKCVKCINECPRNNITYKEKIIIGNNCDLCLCCISNCPKHAINISEETINNVKYSEEKINEIFANMYRHSN